ncbi:putative Riboflavin kinase-like protein [Naja naja]|nr:putative Riboflavin kinase-like protein [Naja naja]
MPRLFRTGSSLLQAFGAALTRGAWSVSGSPGQPCFSSWGLAARAPGDQALSLLRLPSRGCLHSVAMKNLPYFCSGEVVRGFGRGSKELGIRTGWNPYYKNIKKSVETHIIHTFNEDFYGEILSIIIVGYIRPEQNFDSLDALIAAIQHDIDEAKNLLDLPEHQKFKDDNFFHRGNVNSMTNGH